MVKYKLYFKPFIGHLNFLSPLCDIMWYLKEI